MRDIVSPLAGFSSPFGQRRDFSPFTLFADGEAGVWYDPSDLTTLFQDVAGTTPVTTPGQTVALMLDKSGNDYHATQSTAAARPTYQVDAGGRGYLSFDGVNDVLISPSAVFFGDASSMILGAKTLTAPGKRTVSTDSSNFGIQFATTQFYGFVNNFTIGSGGILKIQDYPNNYVVSWLRGQSQNSALLRVDGAGVASTTHDQADNNSRPLAVGGRTTGDFGAMNFFSLVHIARFINDAELSRTETYIAKKTGVTL